MEPVIKRLILQCLKPNDNSRGLNSLNDVFLERVLISFPYSDEQLAKFFVFACPTTYTGINANVFAYHFKEAIIKQDIPRLNNMVVNPERYYLEYIANPLLSEEERSAIRQMELEELIVMLSNFTGSKNSGVVPCLKSAPFFTDIRIIESQNMINILNDKADKNIVIIESTTASGGHQVSKPQGNNPQFAVESQHNQEPKVNQYTSGGTTKKEIPFGQLINILATSGINPSTGEPFELSLLNVLRAKFLKEIKMYQRFMIFKAQQDKKDSLGKLDCK